ncbi:MAG TPA: hypothetical protein VFX30_11795 [bacterium]|nr:hypothetical protein [bacterium]
MSKKRATILGGFAAGFLALAAFYSAGPAGCGGEGSSGGGDGNFACSYEKRVTDGCDGFGFGEWEADCFYFNEDDYTITPEEVCDNITEGGVTCEADCCIDTEFRNVELNEGFCS